MVPAAFDSRCSICWRNPAMRIYTLGYEGLNLHDYIEVLRAANVGVVLDVRENPWSQRPDFIRGNMQPSLVSAGIDYIHVRSAGNPAHIRKTSQSVEECLRRYREHLETNDSCVGELYSYIRLASERGRPACLTCYERSPENCHRSILAGALVRLATSVEPLHLPPVERRRVNTIVSSMGNLHKSSYIHPMLFQIR
jgi:uncharacterized protein (DUF488 family)